MHRMLAPGCDITPTALPCGQTKIPSFFKMLGTKEGNSVPQLERHIMQVASGSAGWGG